MKVGAKLTSLLLILYSAVITILIPILKILTRLSPKLKNQIGERPTVAETAAYLQKQRKEHPRSALFFCSSAGEFEQARPLIDRLTARGDTFVHALIFSRSGYEYAKARGDQTSYSLVPLTDSVWDWGWIFSALRPSVIAVVRHEIWPGFVGAASNFAPVFLLDASASLGEKNSWAKKKARSALLKMFSKIFVVTERDSSFFRQRYNIPKNNLAIAGDTKYDRVLERAADLPGSGNGMTSIFQANAKNRLILGSAHLPDLDLLLTALKEQPTFFTEWDIAIAPHHIDKVNIDAFSSKLTAVGLEPRLFTDKDQTSSNKKVVTILNTMGMLAEAYSLATAAFVGGASHFQVHNVLEPAVHGLALAWGPLYKNSQEAIFLVDEKAATVVHNGQEFGQWLRETQGVNATAENPTAKAVRTLCGATEIIFKEWKPILNG